MQNRWLSVINCTDSSKQLLHNFDVPSPPNINRSILFVQNISNIRSKLKQCTFQDFENCNPPGNLNTNMLSFNCFEPLTQNGVYNIKMGMAKKSYPFDPMPTPLVVKCLDVLLPVITKIVNLSLQSGHFPSAWKEALVLPILIIRNFISNLSARTTGLFVTFLLFLK